MDYIQILVVLSREMYNFMSMIFEVKVSFIFSLLSIFFQIYSSVWKWPKSETNFWKEYIIARK